MKTWRHMLGGGILALTCSNTCSGLEVELFVPLYAYPYSGTSLADLWAGVKVVADSGKSITGIMNPNNGPYADSTATTMHTMALEQMYTSTNSAQALTLLCYVATSYGVDKTEAEVLAEVDEYIAVYPGTCHGIFFDESASGISDDNGSLTDIGTLYKSYYDYTTGKGMKAVFNTGIAADPTYYDFGQPGIVGFENYFSIVRKVGVPRTTTADGVDASQSYMMVHSADELLNADTDSSTADLLTAVVQKAVCNGWGYVYFTDDDLTETNPWNNQPNFWASLVTATSDLGDLSCLDEDGDDAALKIMVPLLPESTSNLDTLMADVLSAVSPREFGDVVSAVVDARAGDMLEKATTLRDAGARVLCYMDAATTSLKDLTASVLTSGDYYEAAVGVCGGFFVANLGSFDGTDIDQLYQGTQEVVAGSTVVFEVVDGSASYLFTNSWDKLSFAQGRVVVATVFDGSGTDDVPEAGGSKKNSAAMMTGFAGTTAECPMAQMNTSGYGYRYVTDGIDFTTLSSLWGVFVTETQDCSTAAGDCSCSGRVCLMNTSSALAPEFYDADISGDPHLVGLKGQKFDFTGQDNGYYNVLSDGPCTVINMRVTAVPGFPEITYITALGMVICGENGKTQRHTVEIIVDEPHTLFSECPNGGDDLCLADGAVTVLIDGEVSSRPGEYDTGDGVNVAAVNIPGQCRPFGFEKYWLAKQTELATDLNENHRKLRHAVPTSAWLLEDMHRTNPDDCRAYVDRATEEATLFEYQSEHVSFQITTPHQSLRVNLGKVHQLAMRDPTDAFDLPDHVAYQMNVGFNKIVLGDNPQGTIGETVRPVLNNAGLSIMQGLDAIRGDEEDYRVECLLCSDFAQLHVQ